eukprot:2932129-Prymnesium_polylepis.1
MVPRHAHDRLQLGIPRSVQYVPEEFFRAPGRSHLTQQLDPVESTVRNAHPPVRAVPPPTLLYNRPLARLLPLPHCGGGSGSSKPHTHTSTSVVLPVAASVTLRGSVISSGR